MNGVKSYVTTRVNIFFPSPDGIACRYCPLLETYSRNQCRRTGEYIVEPKSRGNFCPLEIVEEEREA